MQREQQPQRVACRRPAGASACRASASPAAPGGAGCRCSRWRRSRCPPPMHCCSRRSAPTWARLPAPGGAPGCTSLPAGWGGPCRVTPCALQAVAGRGHQARTVALAGRELCPAVPDPGWAAGATWKSTWACFRTQSFWPACWPTTACGRQTRPRMTSLELPRPWWPRSRSPSLPRPGRASGPCSRRRWAIMLLSARSSCSSASTLTCPARPQAHAYLTNMAVQRSLQRQGLGQLMMQVRA